MTPANSYPNKHITTIKSVESQRGEQLAQAPLLLRDINEIGPERRREVVTEQKKAEIEGEGAILEEDQDNLERLFSEDSFDPADFDELEEAKMAFDSFVELEEECCASRQAFIIAKQAGHRVQFI